MLSNNIYNLPNIYLITTGGTVASTKSDVNVDERYAPSNEGHTKLKLSLIKAVPQLNNLCLMHYIDLPAIDSKDLSFSYIKKIYSAILMIIDEISCIHSSSNNINEHILIAHGTDNMESTLAFLALNNYLQNKLQQHSIKIVMWGAMRTLDHSEQPDGPDNFKTALYFSLDSNTKDKSGVFLAFNHGIQPALLARKNHSASLATFDVDYAILEKYHTLEPAYTINTYFNNVHHTENYGEIAIIHAHISLGALMNLRAHIKNKTHNLRGLIFEHRIHDYTHHNDNLNIFYDVLDTLDTAAENQIPIVINQENYAHIDQSILKKIEQKLMLHNPYLTTEKTLVLMHMLLCCTQDKMNYAESMYFLTKYFAHIQPIAALNAYITAINLYAYTNIKWNKNYPITYVRNYIDMPNFIVQGILDDIQNHKTKGLVIEGTGNGTYQKCLDSIITSAKKMNIPVLRSSICNGVIAGIEGEDTIASNGLSTYDCIHFLNAALQQGIADNVGLQSYLNGFAKIKAFAERSQNAAK